MGWLGCKFGFVRLGYKFGPKLKMEQKLGKLSVLINQELASWFQSLKVVVWLPGLVTRDTS
jgi:hypothetical protein